MNHTKKHNSFSGGEALVAGAIKAGVTFFAGYPITPSSEIMHLWSKLSSNSKEHLFIQMEDEIASIHSLIGASLTGRKCFTATSGPGFSLMQEGLGMAFAMQVPLVVVNSQRQGPGTGMPTIAAQGDVLQTQFGTHGDYSAIVFCPNSVKEMYKYIIEAFNASEECLSPVILLTDAYITHIHEEEDLEKINIPKVKNRCLESLTQGNTEKHFTGLTSKENGEVNTLDPEVYKKWIAKRKNSVLKTGKDYYFYETDEKETAKTLIISYGITSRIIEKIVKENSEYSHFRPITLFPIQKDVLKKITDKYENIVTVEMNEGQYANQIQATLCREIKHVRVLGADPSEEEILRELKNL